MIFTFTLHLHKMETIAKFMPVPPYLQCIQKYKGLIEPLFDYCSAVWDGLTQQLSEKLQKLQNLAIRVITKSSYDTSSRFLLNSLGWDNLSVRRAKQKANLMYKCINNLAPAYLCNLFAPRTPNYYFRGSLLRNSLPEEIRTSNSLGLFN